MTGSSNSLWINAIAESRAKQVKLVMDFLKDIWKFLRERKKFWLAPIIIILLLLGLLIVIGGSSAMAPFIYTLF